MNSQERSARMDELLKQAGINVRRVTCLGAFVHVDSYKSTTCNCAASSAAWVPPRFTPAKVATWTASTATASSRASPNNCSSTGEQR